MRELDKAESSKAHQTPLCAHPARQAFTNKQASAEGQSELDATRSSRGQTVLFVGSGSGEHSSGTLQRLPADPGQALVSGCAVQVRGPIDFRSGVPIPAFIEEPPANLIPDERLSGGGTRQSQSFLLQQRRLLPTVLIPASMGEHEQRSEGLPRSGQQQLAFNNSLLRATKQRQRPDTLHAGIDPQPGLHSGPIENNIAKSARIRLPDLGLMTDRPAPPFSKTPVVINCQLKAITPFHTQSKPPRGTIPLWDVEAATGVRLRLGSENGRRTTSVQSTSLGGCLRRARSRWFSRIGSTTCIIG